MTIQYIYFSDQVYIYIIHLQVISYSDVTTPHDFFFRILQLVACEEHVGWYLDVTLPMGSLADIHLVSTLHTN